MSGEHELPTASVVRSSQATPARRRGQLCTEVRPAGLHLSKPVPCSNNRSHLCCFGVTTNVIVHVPGIALVVGPVLLFIFAVLRSTRARSIGLWIPLWILIGLQVYRVGVELFIHELWLDGLVPRMMTFEGSNFDIYIGATAPLVAWLCRRGRWGLRIALLWNGVGLVAVSNVIIRAVLTAPGPLNFLPTDPPNLAMTLFPYTYLAGFLAPLAVTLHLLALRAIFQRLRQTGDVDVSVLQQSPSTS